MMHYIMDLKAILYKLLFNWTFIGKFWTPPITVNASNYTAGTDITHVKDGLTLQQYEHMENANSIIYSPAVVTPEYDVNHYKISNLVLGFGMDLGLDGMPQNGYKEVLHDGLSLSDANAFNGFSILSKRPIKRIDLTGYSYMSFEFVGYTLRLFDQFDTYHATISGFFKQTGYCNGGPCYQHFTFDLSGYSNYVYRLAWSGGSHLSFVSSFTVYFTTYFP